MDLESTPIFAATLEVELILRLFHCFFGNKTNSNKVSRPQSRF